MRKVSLLLYFLSVFLLYSCEDEQESEMIMIIKPDELAKMAKAGEKILYTIETYSNSGNIRNLKFTTYDPVNGMLGILDSVTDRSRVRFDFQYTVPQFTDTTDIKIRFEAVDEWGYSVSVQRYLKVAGGEIILKELTGITLYSSASGRPDAFNIGQEQLVNSHTVEGDSLLDIYAWQDSTADLSVLSREWRSGSGLKFTRFNGFNYSTATRLSVENAYASGIKLNYIADIKADDVILFGNDRRALGIIKLIYVFDDPGAADDRYIFNLKKIKE